MVKQSTESRPEFMSRQESRKLFLMGLALFLLLAYMVKGAFTGADPGAQGIPVKPGPVPGTSAPPTGGLDYDPETPVVRPHQDPLAAKRTLEAQLAEKAEGGAKPTAFEPSADRLQQVQDLAVDLVEEPGFYELIARVNAMSDEELAKAPEAVGSFSRADLLPPKGFDVRRARETGEFPHLDRIRGKFVHLQGRFATHLFQRVLEKYPNESGLAWVWQGTFMSSNRGYFVTVLDKTFDPKGGPRGEAIELTGAFLKLYSFEPVNKELGVKTFPHLIVKRLYKGRPTPRWDYMNDDKLFVAAALIIFLGFCTWIYARSSAKGAAELEGWRRKRFLERAKRDIQSVKTRTDAKAAEATKEAATTEPEAATAEPEAATTEPEAATAEPEAATPVAEAGGDEAGTPVADSEQAPEGDDPPTA